MSISVIIPAYNASRFIAATIKSVMRQTMPPDEILVIDDGSTDDTASIAEGFGASVRVIRRANARQAASRNFGVQQATSVWVAFVDADDLWDPGKLACQMQELALNPLADLCYTARVEFTVEDDTMKLGALIPVPCAEDIRRALFRNTSFLPSSVVIRRSVFLRAGGFDARYKVIEDWDLWLRLLHSGVAFAGCQEPLLLYRIHTESASHNALAALAEAKQIYSNHVLPYLPKATRWFSHMKSQSGQEAVAALVLRKVHDPYHLRMMALSMLRFPFNKPHRYKVFAHMLYSRLRHALNV